MAISMTHHGISIHDFSTICRVCLVSKENMITYCTPQIINMIEECTSVQEPYHAKFPQQICNNCYWQLKNSYRFKQQYVVSLEILCEILLESEDIENKNSIENALIFARIVRDKLRATSSLCEKVKTSIDSSNNENVLIKTEEFEPIEFKDFENLSLKVELNENIDNKKLQESDESDATCDEDDYTGDRLEDSLKHDDEDEESLEDENDDSNSEKDDQKQNSLADILIKKYKIYDLTCNICKKELSTRATLLRHMETHSTNRIFKYHCPVCKKGFYDRGNLNKHVNRHAGKANYECEICLKRYYELSALALHNKEKHKAQPIKCTKCDLQFYHNLQLQQHEQTHEQKEFICDVCGKVFNLKYKLKDHQVAHSEHRPYTCIHCNKGFKHKFTLTAHIKMRHEDTERRQMCFICGKLFVGGLAKHLESHDTSRINKCDICNRVYTTRSGLQVHLKEKHTSNPDKQRYTCKICDKSLGTKGTLTKHMIFVHSDVRKSCHLCGKTYKTQKNVDAHVAAAHMDIRPFNCSTCNKAFHTKVLLKNHMRSHTGERPFSCTICGKAFGYREVLKTHMKIHNK